MLEDQPKHYREPDGPLQHIMRQEMDSLERERAQKGSFCTVIGTEDDRIIVLNTPVIEQTVVGGELREITTFVYATINGYMADVYPTTRGEGNTLALGFAQRLNRLNRLNTSREQLNQSGEVSQQVRDNLGDLIIEEEKDIREILTVYPYAFSRDPIYGLHIDYQALKQALISSDFIPRSVPSVYCRLSVGEPIIGQAKTASLNALPNKTKEESSKIDMREEMERLVAEREELGDFCTVIGEDENRIIIFNIPVRRQVQIRSGENAIQNETVTYVFVTIDGYRAQVYLTLPGEGNLAGGVASGIRRLNQLRDQFEKTRQGDSGIRMTGASADIRYEEKSIRDNLTGNDFPYDPVYGIHNSLEELEKSLREIAITDFRRNIPSVPCRLTSEPIIQQAETESKAAIAE